jgi:hypothetical protein
VAAGAVVKGVADLDIVVDSVLLLASFGATTGGGGALERIEIE